MDIRISPSNLNGFVQAVSSKSDVHRALICAAFADAPTEISCNLLSKDIEATARCLTAAGSLIETDIDQENGSGTIRVNPAGMTVRKQERKQKRERDVAVDAAFEPEHAAEAKPLTDSTAELFCGESGSTLRFLVPVMTALGKPATFTGEGELPNRPMDALLSVLSAHGVHAVCCGSRCLPLTLSGRLSGGVFLLPGDISSQYITGLLLSFPLIGERAEICLTTGLQSAAYVDMTLDTMSRFGISIQKTGQGYLYSHKQTEHPAKQTAYLSKQIVYPSKQTVYFPKQTEHLLPRQTAQKEKDACGRQVKNSRPYHSPGRYCSDGDWSNAAFWLCAGKLSGNSISVKGLRRESLQGDRAAADLLSLFEEKHQNETKPLRVIDASNIPDLVPAFSALAAATPGTTKFVRAGRLRLKECDRLTALSDVLGKMGARVEERQEELIIEGAADGRLSGGCEVSGHNDHRIVMAAAIAASACRKEVIIKGAQAVQKSYPHFFSDFRKLGGRADVVDLR